MKRFLDFLFRERSLNGRAPLRPRTAKQRRQRGVALVAVMIAATVAILMSYEFGSSTNINIIAASNYRDQMRAHFLARSATNLAELVIRVQQRIDNVKQLRDSGIRITDFADQVLLAFCGSPEEVKAAIGFSSSDLKGLGADIGTCGITGSISTEDDKINLNCANGNDTTAKTLKSALDALVYFPAYDPVFEEPDAEGWRRDRAMQVASIIDYIDADSLRVRDRGTTEDYGSESLKDRYYAKNTYIDTVGEAKLARGVDDRFWTLFGPSFTVYGGCKTNVAALSNVQLIAAILYLAAKNPNDPMLMNPQRLFLLADLVAKAKQFGMTFSSLDDFADFVKDPGTAVGALAGQSGTLAGSAAGAALTTGIPGLNGSDKVGLELDKAKLQQIASAGPRRTYRVEAWGELARVGALPPLRTTITGVWDTKVVPQNVRKPPVPKGAWVYLRED